MQRNNIFIKNKILIYFLVLSLGFSLLFFGFTKKLRAFAEDEQSGTIALPILMYHAVFPDGCKLVPYSIHISSLQQDLDFIIEQGYTTVLTSDLIAFVENKGALPPKPIMLTFDDGFYNILHLVLPELEKRNMRVVCSVTGIFSEKEARDDDRYGYLSFEDIARLQNSGRVEIANHSYNLHRLYRGQIGMKKIFSEQEEDYKKRFTQDVMKLQDKLKNFGVEPIALAYPYGFFEKTSDQYLKELGFKASFICFEKVNRLKRGDSLFGLSRFNRDRQTAQQILSKI
ncbi:MAG: polysaccharide deacetylase family protein [Christensenellaceae bacterium]|jgi:peptidoglycan/xylan/chitin deacetylase (PgdA/CDA1 family)|nr:polysaccharide deacetylase family protein [Christensenellaceae bacterium]